MEKNAVYFVFSDSMKIIINRCIPYHKVNYFEYFLNMLEQVVRMPAHFLLLLLVLLSTFVVNLGFVFEIQFNN